MKKAILVLLALAMVISLAACAKEGGSTPSGSTPGGSTSTPGGSTTTPGGSTSTPGGSTSTPGSSGSSQTAPYEVTFYYICWWNIPSDEGTARVEQLVNDRLKELGYNYTLDIKFMQIADYNTQIDLLLAGGDKVDIFLAFNYANMVNNGYLAPLDEFLDDEMADTAELMGNWMESGKTNGITYALPCHKGVVLTYCYEYQDAYVNGEKGFTYDMTKIKDFYDLEDLYAQLHAKFPNMWVDWNTSRYADMIAQLTKTTVVGTYCATVGDDPTLVNYYTTDAWKSALEYAWKYRNAGYVDPDGSQSQTATTALTADMVIGYNIAYGRDPAAQGKWLTTSFGVPCSAVTTCVQNLTVGGGATWGIGYTSENKSAAATVLNLMWTDYKVLNALMYGIEGIDYVVTEPTTDYTVAGVGAYEYPEGQTADSVSYQVQLNDGIFGDEFLMLRSSGTTSETRQYMMDQIKKAWVCPTFGFRPDSADVSNEIAAVSNVYSQYYNALIYGDIDPEINNPKFLAELESAGLQNIIDTYNAQVSDWLK